MLLKLLITLHEVHEPEVSPGESSELHKCALDDSFVLIAMPPVVPCECSFFLPWKLLIKNLREWAGGRILNAVVMSSCAVTWEEPFCELMQRHWSAQMTLEKQGANTL